MSAARPGARGFVAQQKAASQQVLAQVLSAEPATVESVTAGAARDGEALVRVTWNGAVISVPYPVGLVLEAGQEVVLAVPEKSPPFVWCRLAGTP